MVTPPMPEVGDSVRIRAAFPPGHVRTPAYIRGRQGTVERILGPFPDPERLAYGQKAALRPLYRVRFTMADLWGDGAEAPQDTLDAEVYAHWIEDVP
jgi:nitrile hydratase